ncbi:MAG: hypothetical protein DRQ45_08390 [Gammaproteobacteria bacterium]|nr:MAG: hypothetical protein DRQ45_08390 [Gammaproteobacteria bacterium]
MTIEQAEILVAYCVRAGLQVFIRAGNGCKQYARPRAEYTCEAEQTCTGNPGKSHAQSIDGLTVNEKK